MAFKVKTETDIRARPTFSVQLTNPIRMFQKDTIHVFSRPTNTAGQSNGIKLA